ncbi:proline-rich protein 36-like [Ochlerotatus camptorhynchus]|uniref:proline-rich protein 36-like n=1 Tax=Ochlerotatus camptorhynchus TaxID=644619 RepID=UPI0031D8E510
MSVDETKMEPLPTAESPPPQAAAPTAQALPSPSPPPAATPAASVGVRIRPKICDVRNCDSNSLRNPEILFVCVPGHSYPERRFVWLTLMQAARDKKRSYCCSRHFKVPDDFKDFQEFISAPPGYKRQLLVKKGVVPHLNMPPLNMSALPPLTDRWPMTLPAGMTEADQLRQNAARSSMPPPLGMRGHPLDPHRMQSQHLAYVSSPSRLRYCKAVQTDSTAPATTASAGPRKVPPSLQYCRLCFKRQDLEPIFTGDQTLIEPDLIDQIFGCTEVMICVERDFPSSICTGCYTSVQEFVKFRKLVQLNDQSLRGIPLPSMSSTPTRSPSFGTQTTSVRTKTTEIIPTRPAQKVTPVRTVSSVSPARRREDPLLEVQRVENVERYQRRQQTIERNQPLRAQRMQDTLYPVPYRRPAAETPTSDDPLASAEDGEKPPAESESSSTPEGVQLNGRIVPVTLIRVQAETTDSNQGVELQVPSTGHNATNAEGKSEDVTVKKEEPIEEQQPPKIPSPMNTIRAKPLHQLMASPEQRKLNPPSVLQAVKLLPSATARALANQKYSLKPISTLTRGITSGRFPHRVWKPVLEKSTPKESIGRMFPKSLVRAVKFPGTMTTLFSGSRKHHKSPTPSGSPKPVESPKPAVVVPISNPDERKQPSEKPQVLQEMKLPVKPTAASPVPKPTNTTSATPQPKQKENSVPESPRDPTPNKPIIQAAKLPVKLSAPSPVPKPPPKPKQTETLAAPSASKPPPKPKQTETLPAPSASKPPPKSKQTETPPAPKAPPKPKPTETPPAPKAPPKPKQTETPPAPPAPSSNAPPPSPRSSRVRKVPLKFQDSVGFPMPKIITIKPDPDSPKVESGKVPQEKPKEPPVRSTRRSNVAEEKASESRPPTKPDRKQPEVKNDAKNKQSKEEPAVARLTRSSETGNKKSDTPQKAKPPKRKSDTKPDPVAKEAPPPSKSPKVEPKRNSLDTQKQEQRANGSRKIVPTAEVKQKKSKEPEPSFIPLVSSQDWKCPFCSDKVFEQKKGLVKHLRKRHGMDYALVRQRLAIYGGNWR